jgi:site-specific recombinase XerD
MEIRDVIDQFMLDLEVRGRTEKTLRDYQHRLGGLAQILQDLCQVTELENVRITHLRQCVQHLLTAKKSTGVGASEVVVFLGRGGKPLGPMGVYHIIQRVKRKTGLGSIKFTPHVFRHTFAKMYLEHSGDLFKPSREMGHSDVKVTQEYLKDFSSTEARKDHNTFSPISSINLRKDRRRSKKQERSDFGMYYFLRGFWMK